MRINAYNSFVFSAVLHFSFIAILIASPLFWNRHTESRAIDLSFFFSEIEIETQQHQRKQRITTPIAASAEPVRQARIRNAIASSMPDIKSETFPAHEPEKAAATAEHPLENKDISSAAAAELKRGEIKETIKTPYSGANEPQNNIFASTGAGGSFIKTGLESIKGEKGKSVSPSFYSYPDGISSVDKMVSGGSSDAVDLSSVADRFINHIDSFKSYPYIARKRGIEGTVLVKVKLKKEGDISDVSVVRSSGYEILDESALSLIKKAGGFKHNTGRDIVIKVPITYSLMKSAR